MSNGTCLQFGASEQVMALEEELYALRAREEWYVGYVARRSNPRMAEDRATLTNIRSAIRSVEQELSAIEKSAVAAYEF